MINRANAARVRIPIHTSTPQTIAASQLTAFTAALETYAGKTFASYAALHDFSVREYQIFWRYFVRWSNGRLRLAGSAEPVCEGNDCEHARFFPRLRLNYADNLLNLSVAAADAPALTACHADGGSVRWTRGELRDRVARLAQALSELGLNDGDRVVGVMRNDDAAVITALAVTALGASLSTAAPEMGIETIVDRFAPLSPRMLLAHTAAQAFDTGMPLADTVAELMMALPSLQEVIGLDGGTLPDTSRPRVYGLDELMDRGDAERFAWPHFPFNRALPASQSASCMAPAAACSNI
jgi:acetoacetyl-CoA synthetase